ncbi:MAG: exodeoxyribonuclease III [Candidatus Omnitrophica bacterium]|nr:exodeoxyribonuclease III [Candidatus Omnitrophota bacterium]
MRLMSWNVNGIRAVLKKGFLDFLSAEDPDILCIQEMRALPEQVDLPLNGYHVFWNPAERKGYSGTAVFSKIKPIHAAFGMGAPQHDAEGRVITLEFDDYYLVNVYTPNAGRGLERLAYRSQEWDPAFLHYVKTLEKSKPVVFCGDLNVAHKEIDLANPKGNEGNAGFTPEERQGFDRIVKSGFLDAFREFKQDGGHYTWWSYFGRAREKNIGWRIDYFCLSPELRPHLQNADIHPHVMGSDHCPVSIVMD